MGPLFCVHGVVNCHLKSHCVSGHRSPLCNINQSAFKLYVESYRLYMCKVCLVPWVERICASPYSLEVFKSTQVVNKSHRGKKVKFVRFLMSCIWSHLNLWVHLTWIHSILSSLLQTHLHHMQKRLMGETALNVLYKPWRKVPRWTDVQ